MRNPDRIEKYMKQLQEQWEKVPDWRFGQLMSNLLGEIYTRSKQDFFYLEDEDFFELADEIFAEWAPKTKE